MDFEFLFFFLEAIVRNIETVTKVMNASQDGWWTAEDGSEVVDDLLLVARLVFFEDGKKLFCHACDLFKRVYDLVWNAVVRLNQTLVVFYLFVNHVKGCNILDQDDRALLILKFNDLLLNNDDFLAISSFQVTVFQLNLVVHR